MESSWTGIETAFSMAPLVMTAVTVVGLVIIVSETI